MNYSSKLSCKYCNNISKKEKNYPNREAIYSFEGIVHRCAWHSQFQCDQCKKFFHFSWLYYCPQENHLICGSCNSPSLEPVKFWDKTYAYQFKCDYCNENHHDLLYSEYCGIHPWQQIKKSENNEEFDLKQEITTVNCILHQADPLKSHWKPPQIRQGEKISLTAALNIQNNVVQLKKDWFDSSVVFHDDLKSEHEISVKDTAHLWEVNSNNWLKSLPQSDIDSGDLNRERIIDPTLMKMLGDVKNLNILDAGCGSGYLSRKIAKLGGNVTGIDNSKTFINHCNEIQAHLDLNCKFIHGSLTNMPEIPSEKYDVVISNIVMVDIPDYQAAFNEIHRVLKEKGRFLWSNVHPVFGRMGAFDYRLPMDTKRKEDRIWKVIDRYFDSGAYKIGWGNIGELWQFDRTLTEYTHALKEAGFVIREIVEPTPPYSEIQKHPYHLAFDTERWSHFIIYDCIKLDL